MRILFYVMSWFSLAAFKILSFFDFWHLIIMCLCSPLCIQPVWNLLCIINLDVRFLPQIWVFLTFISLSNISTNFSFSSPSGTPLMYVLICLMESHMCHRLSSLFFIFFFLFLWLDNLNWFIVKFTDYFFLFGQVCCWSSLFNFQFSQSSTQTDASARCSCHEPQHRACSLMVPETRPNHSPLEQVCLWTLASGLSIYRP